MKKLILSLALCCSMVCANAGKPFTYADIQKGTFAQKSVPAPRSMANGLSYTALNKGKVVRYSYATGQLEGVMFDNGSVKPAITPSGYQLSPDEKTILLETNVNPIYRHSYTADYYLYVIETGELKPLLTEGNQKIARFSPDGKKIAFVRENNLFVVDVQSGELSQLTTDGKYNNIINGHTDWVYEEEFGFTDGFQWSPDSKKIAYYRFDESHVSVYPMNRFDNKLYPTVYSFKYPKAGEPNAYVDIYVHDLESGNRTKIDVGAEKDQYIPWIQWTSKGQLTLFRANRLQNDIDLMVADNSGATRVIYEESDPRYIERISSETATFLEDGDRYIVFSERNGWRHMYLYSISKGFLNQITDGQWEVTQLCGVDEKKGIVYYMSTETSPLEKNLYSIKLNGKGKKRITPEAGTYTINFSKGMKYYMSKYSNITTPMTISLHTADGKLVRMIEDNAKLKATLEEYGVPQKEFFTFKNSMDIPLNGYMIKPNNFDPNKKYPVFMTQYSGPGSQSVMNRWQMTWEEALVQEGYIVVCVDGRGTGYRGADFRKCTYGNLGYFEVVDQTDAAKYLATLPYVDGSRIGIYGWSFGGFMSLNCILKSADVFKLAISIAPVTNWRYYDSIYTEIYNGLPQNNPEGYDQNSPINFADRLKGKLLIVHGSADDNVHMQNAMEMIRQLVNAGKQFDMMIYPDKNHSILGEARHHLMNHCIKYVKENL